MPTTSPSPEDGALKRGRRRGEDGTGGCGGPTAAVLTARAACLSCARSFGPPSGHWSSAPRFVGFGALLQPTQRASTMYRAWHVRMAASAARSSCCNPNGFLYCANVRRACVRPARSADGAHFCVGGHRGKWEEGRNRERFIYTYYSHMSKGKMVENNSESRANLNLLSWFSCTRVRHIHASGIRSHAPLTSSTCLFMLPCSRHLPERWTSGRQLPGTLPCVATRRAVAHLPRCIPIRRSSQSRDTILTRA